MNTELSVATTTSLAAQSECAMPVAAQDSASLMGAIISAGSTPGVNVENIERMMALYERLEGKKAERAFNTAMNEAQTDIRPIAADLANKATSSRYASYLKLDKALRPTYTKHGFSLSFDTGEAPSDMVRVLCYVSHRDGHSRTYKVDIPADGKGARGGDVMTKTHAAGAAMTYGQRYLLKLIFNVAVGEDDDGNAAALPGGCIEEHQVGQLFRLASSAYSDEDKREYLIGKICKRFKVSHLAEIKTKDFREACTLFNDTITNVRAKAAKAAAAATETVAAQ
jgi:hypothetical protein